MKKSWVLILSIVLAAALSIGGTVAYLQDTDSDVNVMTLGKVDIVQVEEERSGNELVQFDNYNKVLFPGVYSEDKPVMTDGYYAAQNAIDKIVSVDNEGKSDAYVRTIFAFEQGTMTDAHFEEVMNINKNEADWSWTKIGNGQTIGTKPGTYTVYIAVYNKILPKGESTSESLKQVLLAKEGTNEDVKALDANGNQMYEILVLSQAVQSMGFEEMGAAAALDEAFGDVKANLSKWMGGMEAELPGADEPAGGLVMNASELKNITNALAVGEVKTVQLGSNITLDALNVEAGHLTIDLNGQNLNIGSAATGWNLLYSTANADSGASFTVGTGAALTITGTGNITGDGVNKLFSVLGTLKLNVTGTISNGSDTRIFDVSNGRVTIQSGEFSCTKEELEAELGDAGTIGENVTFEEEAAVEVIVTDVWGLYEALESGETVIGLGADIVNYNYGIYESAGDNVTINLNGYTLDTLQLYNGSSNTMRIVGPGKIYRYDEEYPDERGSIDAYNNVVLDNVAIEHMELTAQKSGTTITVIECTFENCVATIYDEGTITGLPEDVPVTEITNVSVASDADLDTAVALANEGKAVRATLTQDVVVETTKFVRNGNLTLRLQGYKLSGSINEYEFDEYGISCISIWGGASVVIEGWGSSELNWEGQSPIFYLDEGNLTMNTNGTVQHSNAVYGAIFGYNGNKANVIINNYGSYMSETDFVTILQGIGEGSTLTMNEAELYTTKETLEEECKLNASDYVTLVVGEWCDFMGEQ